MDMTVSVLRAFIDELEPLRAEREADLIGVAIHPHLTVEAQKTRMERLVETMKRAGEKAESAAEFSFNGIRMGARALRRKFGEAFGDAFRGE
jgi:hypothetical protein